MTKDIRPTIAVVGGDSKYVREAVMVLMAQTDIIVHTSPENYRKFNDCIENYYKRTKAVIKFEPIKDIELNLNDLYPEPSSKYIGKPKRNFKKK